MSSLADCRACQTDFVNAVQWEPVGDHSWWMLLRCGACGYSREVTVPNDVAKAFDEELDRRADPIARALHKLDLERMAAEVETLALALRRDLIDAADFAR